MLLHKKLYSDLTTDELYELLRIRSEVFVVEQDCVYQDLDYDDQPAVHLWITEDDRVVALCRVCPAGTHMKEVSIGRVITTERGKGYGKQIMLAGIKVAQEHFGARVIDIESQEYAKGFYEQVGFRQSSEPFILDGISHIKMTWREMENTKEIYLAGGCFWGTEHYFKQVRGVVATEVGFANGHFENPTYKQVKTQDTGFAETVHITYDPATVSLELLLNLYFRSINPLSLNRQGEDSGTQYRTGIYYTDGQDLPTIDNAFMAEQAKYDQPLAVEKLPLQNFYTAEEYHQDYLDKNPDGYCHLPAALFEYARKVNQSSE